MVLLSPEQEAAREAARQKKEREANALEAKRLENEAPKNRFERRRGELQERIQELRGRLASADGTLDQSRAELRGAARYRLGNEAEFDALERRVEEDRRETNIELGDIERTEAALTGLDEAEEKAFSPEVNAQREALKGKIETLKQSFGGQGYEDSSLYQALVKKLTDLEK